MKLDIDFPKAFLNGWVGIEVKGAQAPLSLDCTSLEISSVTVNGKRAKFRVDKKSSKLVVTGVPKRKSVVAVEYTKQVSDDVIFGLYKSKYGKDYLLATDLEPAEARSVLPCVDEPAYKAVFKLQITTDSGLKVIANTPVKTAKSSGRRTTTVFQDTPRMSTYLLFFAVGKMDEERTKVDGIEVVTATRPGQGPNSRLALEICAKSLEDFQRYYDVPYPLKKLHIVALPEYHTGAMENWGAISSRESYALFTEKTAFAQKARGAVSMVHEVAHQWFGDLVTMKWWDDLWLNESFATVMGYKMLDRMYPSWENWSIFLRDETFRALDQDALSTTHPIQTEVKTVEEAMHNFDAISYNKGGSILRMLEGYVGEDAFRRGVSDYLKRFSFSNASGSDLWKALGRASKLPVSRVAKEWLTRPGYPVLEVKRKGDSVTISQRPFRILGKGKGGPWPVPLSLRADGKTTSGFFDTRLTTLKVPRGSGLLLNPGRTGFYVTLYDEEGYGALAKQFAKLSPYDRAGLMNDLGLFLAAGVVKPDLYFRFLSLCGSTPDSITTETAAGQLATLNAIAWDSPQVQAVHQDFYPPLIRAIGEEPKAGEPEYVGAAREALTSEYANLSPEYAAKLAPRFEDYSKLDSNLKAAVAIGYAHTNGAKAKTRLFEMVRTLEGEVDRAKVWEAICSMHDPKVVVEALDLSISGEVSRSDSAYPMLSGAYNPHVREAYWEWLTSRYEKVRGMYGGSQQFYLYLGLIIPVVGVGNERRALKFLSGKRLKEGGSSYARALENLKINSRLRQTLLAPRSGH